MALTIFRIFDYFFFSILSRNRASTRRRVTSGPSLWHFGRFWCWPDNDRLLNLTTRQLRRTCIGSLKARLRSFPYRNLNTVPGTFTTWCASVGEDCRPNGHLSVRSTCSCSARISATHQLEAVDTPPSFCVFNNHLSNFIVFFPTPYALYSL